MRLVKHLSGLAAGISAATLAAAAWAQDGLNVRDVIGKPHPDGVGFQVAATELARDQQWLDHMLMYLCFGVSGFVCVLLLICIFRYNSRANPTPARFTHNTPLEITWTLIPVLILVVLGSFSLPILFKQQEIPKADILIKVTGNQWYWSYEYPDIGISFDAFRVDGATKVDSLGDDQPMGTPEIHDEIADMKLKALGYTPDEFLLATDNAVVVPVGKTIVMHVTSSDVIHSWTVPAFAVKQDGVPGRIAELWFKAEKEGTFFGQCSELCGKDHAYMPITVKVVSEQAYNDWVAKTKTADAGRTAPVQIAASN